MNNKILPLPFFAAMVTIFLSISNTVSAQNVGIGEPNPSEKLDVNGRIVAKGYKNTILTAEGDNSITLVVPNSWTDVEDLSLTFTLEEATTVISSFSMFLVNNSSTDPFAGLRLNIDGIGYSPTIYRFFNASEYYTLTNQHIMELAAGSHTIKVQYYTSAAPFQSGINEFQERKLQVLVFGSN